MLHVINMGERLTFPSHFGFNFQHMKEGLKVNMSKEEVMQKFGELLTLR